MRGAGARIQSRSPTPTKGQADPRTHTPRSATRTEDQRLLGVTAAASPRLAEGVRGRYLDRQRGWAGHPGRLNSEPVSLKICENKGSTTTYN